MVFWGGVVILRVVMVLSVRLAIVSGGRLGGCAGVGGSGGNCAWGGGVLARSYGGLNLRWSSDSLRWMASVLDG